MALTHWKPKKYNDPLRDLLDMEDRLFGLTLFPSTGKGNGPAPEGWIPSMDVSEDKDNITVKADLPGLKQEDIEVTVEDNILSIKGQRSSEHEQKDRNYHVLERSFGAFQRSLQLGSAVDKDKIKATYHHGVLEVILPKSEQVKPKQVRIDVT